MPHLTLQVSQIGGVIDLLVGVSRPRRVALEQAKQPVPQPVPIRALVDTGASITSLDPTVIAALALTPVGVVQLITPSTGALPHQCNQYDVSLFLQHPSVMRTFHEISVIECALLHQGFHMLFGRDMLAWCLLVYDGQANVMQLAF